MKNTAADMNKANKKTVAAMVKDALARVFLCKGIAVDIVPNKSLAKRYNEILNMRYQYC